MKDPSVKDYIPPLGREQFAYLVLLNLSAGASIAEVGTADNQYRVALRANEKKKRAALIKQREVGEITAEQCESERERLKAEANERELELNHLREEFERKVRQERELAHAGFSVETSGWHPLCPPLDSADAFLRFLLRRRPLDAVDDEMLAAVVARWVREASFAAGLPSLPSERIAAGEAPSLRLVRDLVVERDLAALLSADALWANLRGTNREVWRQRVETWACDVVGLGPDFETDPSERTAAPPLFPALCGPERRTVDKLELEEMETAAASRRGEEDALEGGAEDLEAFLRRLIAQRSGENEAP